MCLSPHGSLNLFFRSYRDALSNKCISCGETHGSTSALKGQKRHELTENHDAGAGHQLQHTMQLLPVQLISFRCPWRPVDSCAEELIDQLAPACTDHLILLSGTQ